MTCQERYSKQNVLLIITKKWLKSLKVISPLPRIPTINNNNRDNNDHNRACTCTKVSVFVLKHTELRVTEFLRLAP